MVARLGEIPEGGRKLVSVRGRDVALFNVKGEYFALLDRCPHEGGSLVQGQADLGEVQLARAITTMPGAARSSAAPGTAGNSTCAPASPSAIPSA